MMFVSPRAAKDEQRVTIGSQVCHILTDRKREQQWANVDILSIRMMIARLQLQKTMIATMTS
jgi:hypothetical protein